MSTQVKERPAFREIKDGAASLFVSEQGGTPAQSVRLLADNGLRLLTYQEALARSPELIRELQGKWFYLDGQGIRKDGFYAFDKQTGELVRETAEGPDQKVRVYSGNKQLSISVNPDYSAAHSGRRFNLFGYDWTSYVAPVVVGVKQPELDERYGLNFARFRILDIAGPGSFNEEERLFQDAYKSRAGMIMALTNLGSDWSLTATQAASEIDVLVEMGYLERTGSIGMGAIYRTTPEGYRAVLRYIGRDESRIEQEVAEKYPELQARRS